MTTRTGAAPARDSRIAIRRRLWPLYAAAVALGFLLWVPVEKLFMSEIGFNAASIGVMAAAYAAIVPIVEVPSGLLADRWSRRGVLMVAALALALMAFIGGLSTNVPTYIAASLLVGVYFAMYSGTMDSIVYDTVLEELGTSELFERQIGRVRGAESAAYVAGALAGGLVAQLTEPRVTYFLTVPFALLAIAFLARFREPHSRDEQTIDSVREQITLTYRTLTRTRRLAPIVLLLVLTSVLTFTILEFGPLWLIALDTAPGIYGPYWALLTATIGLGGLAAGRLALERPIVLAGVIVVLLGSSVALTWANLAAAITAQAVLVFVLLVATIRGTQLLHDSIPSAVRTGVASGVSALGSLCFLPFSLLLGFLTQAQDVYAGGWLIVGATVIAAGALIAIARLGPPGPGPAEELTTRLLRDVRRCLVVWRHEIEPLDCNETVELVTSFLEDDLDPHAELRFTNHVHGCTGCTEYLDQMRQTVAALRELPAHEQLTPAAREALVAEFRTSMQEEIADD